MSGDSFNYSYHRVNDFVETLKDKIAKNDTTNVFGEKYGYDQTTLQALGDLAKLGESLSTLMHAAEWLYSGDKSEKNFMEIYQAEMVKIAAISNQVG